MPPRAAPTEWSLVAFTLHVQAAVGTCVVGLCFGWIARRFAPDADVEVLLAPLPGIALLLLAAAVVTSLLHLGRPTRARFAAANLGSSWLSREVVLALAFGALLALLYGLGPFDVGGAAVREVLAVVVGLLGLALVGTIARLYRIRTVPAWDSWATPATFFTSALILGACVVVLRLATRGMAEGVEPGLTEEGLRWLGLGVAVLVGFQMVVASLHLRSLALQGGVAAESAAIVRGPLRSVWFFRLLLAFVGGASLARVTWYRDATEPPVQILIYVGLLVVSEILGRILFYRSRRRVGL